MRRKCGEMSLGNEQTVPVKELNKSVAPRSIEWVY